VDQFRYGRGRSQRDRAEGGGVRRLLELELKRRRNRRGRSSAKKARRSPSLFTSIPLGNFLRVRESLRPIVRL
jgi:hypothetical protein